MEKFYLGSKLMQAWPAVRITTRDGKFEYAEIGDVVDPNAQKVEEGYRVQYDDGYRSWSPKDVFERSYRPTTGLSFGLAIEAAKMGQKIARAGWNGKGQYVELACCIAYLPWTRDRNDAVNINHDDIGNMAFAFVGTRGVQLGWLASQADMLADDWMIVE